MDRFKLNNTQDIDILKQKLATYKNTLETLKSGNVVDDYLLMKHGCYAIKEQVSILEGEVQTMKEQQELQIAEYKKMTEFFSDKMESLSESFGQLQGEIANLTNTVNALNINELLLKIDYIVHKQKEYYSEEKEENNVMKILKKEMEQLKKDLISQEKLDGTPKKNTVQKLYPSSYMQLKGLIQSSTGINPSITLDRSNFFSHINHSSPLHQFRHVHNSYGTKIQRDRNTNNIFLTSGDHSNHRHTKNSKTKNKKKMFNEKEVLNQQPIISQAADNNVVGDKETSPQANQVQTTPNKNLDRITTNKTTEITDKQVNISENSNTTLNEIKEDVFQANINTKEIQIQTNEKDLKHIETENSNLEGESKNEGEERSSFFSFLQRSKYFGK
ncbi:hypothetical protein [Metabacillus halosaccharovorans]|uniref:Uncharacterized protein n=1 Tax=Metabacillus halosaccharovorans TaxID=930124 RepID=A0ABT3DEE6_9BACI|nr:hypothetical protein [Metabacillus halosaccharovorans]MCV9885440.1 hypothetical protein [Metabacillus halosaccharovorans]